MRELPNGEDVTVLRPGAPTQDRYGNDVPGPAAEIPVYGCAVAPRDGTGAGANEIIDARDTVIVGLTLYAPYGTDIRATDRVRVGGELYEVDGQPGSFRSPFTGSTGPVVVALELVTG
ncbi:hypothetical protein GCM10010317_076800 [Streptomyces mirabilis]|uniref:hypothetical protein n=1 Tax=Streptomyces mirabilis TaxID=68239 RepID=UPI00167D177A|nr:hypothetical protein [Streptomyces mirabilis]GHD70138.1 hypothetical protein GCM10010317_076800 [Streptomyces mirabilis]